MPATSSITQVWAAGSAPAEAAMTPRDDVVGEAVAGDGRFVQRDGPFEQYERTVTTEAHTVRETITYRLYIPWFGWLFALPMRGALRRRRQPGTPPPWWSPPDRLTPRQVLSLGLLAAASLSAAFVNTIFTQTANFAADDFGINSQAQGVGGVIVRLGVVIAIPFSVWADRVGRRRVIVITAWLAPAFTALGALAPNFWVLVVTQAIGRPLSLVLALLIGVVVAEEMPRNSRAYALSILALAGGLGAGVAVAALPLADLGASGWRLVYVISVVWFLAALHLARALPETHRFEAPHTVGPPMRRGRFASIVLVAIASNLFVGPASFFQNRFLKDVRGFTGADITAFTLCTATPASIGLILGGRIADSIGRRALLIICLPSSTLLLVGSFTFHGPAMWLSALFGGLLAGVAYPAFTVYRTEMFPTGNRGRANGWITALSLAGSSIGLIVAGKLVDHGWPYSRVMLMLGGGQLIAAVIAYVAYPETAHLALEELNPEDPALADG